MDVELVFEGGTTARTYDSAFETPESFHGTTLDGWCRIGDVYFHARRLLYLRWVDPIKEASA